MDWWVWVPIVAGGLFVLFWLIRFLGWFIDEYGLCFPSRHLYGRPVRYRTMADAPYWITEMRCLRCGHKT